MTGVSFASGRGRLVLLGFACLLLGSCESPSETSSGDVVVSLVRSPFALDGVLVEVRGGGVENISTEVGQVQTVLSSGNRAVVLVTGRLISLGPLLTIALADRSDVPEVIILQAARGASGGYANVAVSELSLSRPLP